MQKVDQKNTIEGVFLRELKNRFLCEVELNGTPVVCYVPSSCHLDNFLKLQGRRVLLTKNQGNKTRTEYALFAMPYKQSCILLSPSVANQAVAASLKSRRFSFLGGRQHYRHEFKVDGYKADLYIEDTQTIIETKAVITTEAEAIFPTVFSERTLKQMFALEQRLSSGHNACLFIVSLNPYVRKLWINSDCDFFHVLKRCLDTGLILRAYCCRYKPKEGIVIDKTIPIMIESQG